MPKLTGIKPCHMLTKRDAYLDTIEVCSQIRLLLQQSTSPEACAIRLLTDELQRLAHDHELTGHLALISFQRLHPEPGRMATWWPRLKAWVRRK